MTLAEQILAAADTADFGTATAAKRGRNPKWPYVPVIRVADQGKHQTTQIKGKAFATREEAVTYAQRCIDQARKVLAFQLADPRMRALREYHGLPRELPTQEGGE